MPDQTAGAAPVTRGLDRRGWSDLLILTIAAAALRLIGMSHLGIDHFDEGEYAMSATALATGTGSAAMYPLQHLHSPPLFFGLAAALMRISGTGLGSLFGISIAAGVGTVILVYGAAYQWFGRAAAGAAALAVAVSDFHILYSRAALADVLFADLLLLAVTLFAAADDRHDMRTAALAGLVTGLAWNTKYHGWLAIVVSAVAILSRAIAGDGRALRPAIARLGLGAAVAVAVYLPWFLYIVTQEGGYARLVAEQARFLQPTHVIQNVVADVRNLRYLEGWSTRLGGVALVGWIALVHPKARRADSLWVALLLLLAGLTVGTTVSLGVISVTTAFLMVRRKRLRPPLWYPVALLAVLTVLTPFYWPYPRLLLPLFIASVPIAGGALSGVLGEDLLPQERKAVFVTMLALSLFLAGGVVAPAAFPWTPRNSLAIASKELNRLASLPDPIIVVAEPPVVYYLRRTGRVAWHADLPDDAMRYVKTSEPYYLVGGIYTRSRMRGAGSLPAWLERHPEATRVGFARVNDMSDVRLFDDFVPQGAHRFREEGRGDYDLLVYRVVPQH